MLQARYVGMCPNCNNEEDNSLTWIKTEGDCVSTHYCRNCKRVFKVKYGFDILDENQSVVALTELEKGIRIIQYRPNYFSGYTDRWEYVRSYEELICIDWVNNFMKGNEEDGEFLHFRIGTYKWTDEKDLTVVTDTNQAILVAQYSIKHWAVCHIFGNYNILGLDVTDN